MDLPFLKPHNHEQKQLNISAHIAKSEDTILHWVLVQPPHVEMCKSGLTCVAFSMRKQRRLSEQASYIVFGVFDSNRNTLLK